MCWNDGEINLRLIHLPPNREKPENQPAPSRSLQYDPQDPWDWYIYLNIYLKTSTIHVWCLYTRPMDPISSCGHKPRSHESSFRDLIK